jgi:hypothetical protein
MRFPVLIIVLFLYLAPYAPAQEPSDAAKAGAVTEASEDGSQPPQTYSRPLSNDFVEPAKRTETDYGWSRISKQTQVNWDGLLVQSSVFMTISNAFRVATEPGTREGLHGPFIKNYGHAVGSLHGWADGDEFYVNYVGHPMEGAVAGYILVQNDLPQYRYAIFGKNREYWNSRMRAMAFAYVYSVLFEIGPTSEASIGSIQRIFPQQGFVDHVITPTVGLGWMIAEDALDKYVMTRLERRLVNKPYVVMLLRGFMSPSRSFANLMKFEVPWHRDTRPDLFGADPMGEAVQNFIAERRTLQISAKNREPKEGANSVLAPFEFDFAFQTSQYGGTTNSSCTGGGGTALFRVASRWQALLDVGGCKLTGMDRNWSGDSLHFLGGGRWTPWASGKWSLHAQLLAGGEKMTHELMFPEKKAALYADWVRQGSNPETKPLHDQYTVQSEVTGPSFQGGVGLSYRLNSALQFRVANVDYRRTWFPSLDGANYTRSFTFSTGLTLRMGTW